MPPPTFRCSTSLRVAAQVVDAENENAVVQCRHVRNNRRETTPVALGLAYGADFTSEVRPNIDPQSCHPHIPSCA